jgi:hypothetical protein
MSLVSVRKKGYLHKLPIKGLVKKWHRRWFVLHSTTIDGIVRLEYFDNESFEATAMGKRTIPLRQCRDLCPASGNKTHPYVFQFTTPMGHHVFAADTHTDMEEWMSTMQEAIMEDRQRNRRKKTQSMILQKESESAPQPSLSASGTTSVPLTMKHQEHAEGNPYEPSNSGTYRVTLELNESAKRLKFTAMIYNLEISPEHITLIAADSGADIAQWSYRQVRTYGKSSGKFNFECGRLAKTGAGNFVFKTTCAKEIFGVVHHNIKRIRKEMEEEVRLKKEGGRQQGAGMVQSKPPAPNQSAAESVDYRVHQPMKPVPYKPKKSRKEPTLSVGTYREFGNPPTYEEIAGAGPIKEEEQHQVGDEQKVPEGLYSTVDKSKKKKKKMAQGGDVGEEQKVPEAYSPVNKTMKKTQDLVCEDEKNSGAENPTANTSPSMATNDPFFLPLTSSSPVTEDSREKSSDNPFQLDPFLFSPQPGANSFNLAPDADPFALPPPPNDVVNLGSNVFDDLGQLDISAPAAGGGLDTFNFHPLLTGPVPSTNGPSNLVPLVGNPIGDVSNPSGLNFDIDLLDDRLFDTLARLEPGGDGIEKEDLGKGATAGGGRTQKTLSKQEFDDLWDGISAAMPTIDT